MLASTETSCHVIRKRGDRGDSSATLYGACCGGEVGGYFGNRRAYDHNCCIQTGNSVGEGWLTDLLQYGTHF